MKDQATFGHHPVTITCLHHGERTTAVGFEAVYLRVGVYGCVCHQQLLWQWLCMLQSNTQHMACGQVCLCLVTLHLQLGVP
jgi:hypothetical protein